MKKNKSAEIINLPKATNRGIPSIDSLWGLSSKKYKSDNLEDYEIFLKQCTQFDLEKHAFEYDISPDVPRDIMIDQLVRLFKMDSMSKKGKLAPLAAITPEMNKELIKIVNS